MNIETIITRAWQRQAAWLWLLLPFSWLYALLKDAPILILDEATSALDNESEHYIQKALDNIMRDRTTLVIAHRLTTIESADRIAVLDAGQIVEIGTHAELMQLHGHYAQMYARDFE